MMEFVKYAMSGGFWHFVGCYVLLAAPLTAVGTVAIRALQSFATIVRGHRPR